MKSFFSHVLIWPIKFYQWTISPILGQNCRHIPTCSSYAIEAIQIWGPLKGLKLAISRIRKCHPWGTSGYDPVPQKDVENKKRKPHSN